MKSEVPAILRKRCEYTITSGLEQVDGFSSSYLLRL